MTAAKSKARRRTSKKATLPTGLANELRDNLSPHAIALLVLAAGEYSRIKPRGHFSDAKALSTARQQLSWLSRAMNEMLGGYNQLNDLLADVGQ